MTGDAVSVASSSGHSDTMEKLRDWLAASIPGASDLILRDIVEPAQGFSSKTILFTAAWREHGALRERALVARIQRNTACPMLGDIFHQYRVMRAVKAAAADVAIPQVVLAEENPAVLGDPFFLMDRIDGRVPPDFPSYHAEGWFADLSAADRARAWWNGIEEMARLHSISWQRFPFLAGSIEEPPTARFFLETFIGRWLDWATQGRAYPALEEALQFLIAHEPPLRQSGLVWNDARLGNTMFAPDLRVASLFDFEVASVGPPELDMAHWLYLDEVFSTQFGIDRISGIPDRRTTIQGFERIYGWEMPYFSYYEAVAALKIVALSIRDYSNGKTMNAPEALPNFLMDRLNQYLSEYRSYLRQI